MKQKSIENKKKSKKISLKSSIAVVVFLLSIIGIWILVMSFYSSR